jgi:protein-disulfide isomerase
MATKKEKEKREERKQRAQHRNAKRTALWTSVLIGLGVVVFVVVQFASSPSVEVAGQSDARLTEISEEEWIKGNPKATVTLVEYSDFQCPSCAMFYPILRKLDADFGDKVRIVYRHFPLNNHLHAKMAAQAAEAAGKQGKFWKMHDLIFDQQQEWSATVGSARGRFIGYAKELALDMERFEADLDAKPTREAVDTDHRSGERLGVNSTPTFFLNGVMIKNLRNENELRNLIQKAIAGPA